MSIFSSHDHKWRNYGPAHDGHQQQTCTSCGKVRTRQVRGVPLFHTHSWPAGRLGETVACACGKTRRIG